MTNIFAASDSIRDAVTHCGLSYIEGSTLNIAYSHAGVFIESAQKLN